MGEGTENEPLISPESIDHGRATAVISFVTINGDRITVFISEGRECIVGSDGKIHIMENNNAPMNKERGIRLVFGIAAIIFAFCFFAASFLLFVWLDKEPPFFAVLILAIITGLSLAVGYELIGGNLAVSGGGSTNAPNAEHRYHAHFSFASKKGIAAFILGVVLITGIYLAKHWLAP